MSPPWLETAPSPADVVRLAAAHGLVVDPASIRFNEIGLDFRVAFATDADGGQWVLRIPRRPDAAVKAAAESKILALVARHLPVAVPDWRIATESLIAYPLLPGSPGLTFDPRTYDVTWHFEQTSPQFSETLGAAIAALHSIDPDEARAAGLPTLSPAQVREKWHADLNRVRESFTIPDPQWQSWQEWLADESYWPGFSVPIHGDLYVGHVMVDPSGRATGILDWTEARVGDPAVDFVGHLKVFGEAGLAALLAHYRASGGQTWPRIVDHCRQLLSVSPVSYAIYALLTGDPQHQAAAQAQLTPEII